tara:strand:- start:84 stop:422 length:339 start_codon:yes stop_codon:yes gene_type:complete
MPDEPTILASLTDDQPPRVAAERQSRPEEPPPVAPSDGMLQQLCDEKWIMLAMLFFVTAALGLPWLWKSRGFSKPEKKFWTVVISIYTALILWGFGAVMWWSYTRITEALQW